MHRALLDRTLLRLRTCLISKIWRRKKLLWKWTLDRMWRRKDHWWLMEARALTLILGLKTILTEIKVSKARLYNLC